MTRALALLPLTLAALLIAPPLPPARAAGCVEDAMLVFDGSGSMSEIGFDIRDATRIEDARTAITRALPRIAPLRRVGLVIYGPGPNGSCGNIDLRFGPIHNAAPPIINAENTLIPGGLTPLTASVRAAAEALDYRAKPGVIVLVTDGNETCGGRPCTLGANLAATARDLTIHVIGFKAEVDYWAWDNPEQAAYSGTDTVARCLSDRTGGMFVSTDNVDELSKALEKTFGCPLLGGAPNGKWPFHG